jgi:dipeptidyl aminopeptidase/acylaminoacyl peptidase
MLNRALGMLGVALAVAVAADTAQAKPPATAFTPIAEIHDMALSPDGKRVAWVQNSGDGDGVVERNLETGTVTPLLRADGDQIDTLRYLTDRYLHLMAYHEQYSASRKEVFQIATVHILDLARNVSYRFDGYGRIVAINDDTQRVVMEANGEVMEIDLATGSVMSGGVGRFWEDTHAVDASGALRAAQDINRETGINRIMAASGSDRRVIFEEGPKPVEVRLLGLMPDGASVMVEDRRDGGRALRSLGLADGALSEPLFSLPGSEPLAPFRDRSGAIVGASVSGPYPRYEFFDADLAADARNLRASFPGQAVTVINWSDDKNKILVSVEGGIEPGRYAIFDRKARKLVSLGQKRPAIPKPDMGEVVTIEYATRDGRKIGAVFTWPARVAADRRRKLPLVVVPHDGPDTYSSVGFDWIAQFLANEGYAVLQPNYRGSGGQGTDFRAAGYDEFGRKMQHDITDGVHAVVQMGWVDDDRVCIIGKGWGGYMALMGGAITPHQYRCVAGIGPVTDLPDFMKRRLEGDQRYNDYMARWKLLLGDPEGNRTTQERYSPVNLARQFAAPVLLIHTDLDRFSPDRQSQKMKNALQANGKTVKHVLIEQENDALLKEETRQRILGEIKDFLTANMTIRSEGSTQTH